MTAFYRLDVSRRVRLATIHTIVVRPRITGDGEIGIVTITTNSGTVYTIECVTLKGAIDVAADIERKASAGIAGTEEPT